MALSGNCRRYSLMMKKRIDKKIHCKYSSDILLELALNSWSDVSAENLSTGEEISVDSDNIPKTFYKLYPKVKKCRLEYILKRVTLDDVPVKEKYWWHTKPKTKYFSFFPYRHPSCRRFTAVDFTEKS